MVLYLLLGVLVKFNAIGISDPAGRSSWKLVRKALIPAEERPVVSGLQAAPDCQDFVEKPGRWAPKGDNVNSEGALLEITGYLHVQLISLLR